MKLKIWFAKWQYELLLLLVTVSFVVMVYFGLVVFRLPIDSTGGYYNSTFQ